MCGFDNYYYYYYYYYYYCRFFTQCAFCPQLEYASPAWNSCSKSDGLRLEKLQLSVARAALGMALMQNDVNFGCCGVTFRC